MRIGINLQFIDKPYFVSRDQYAEEIRHMAERLTAFSGVQAIYQIGSVSTPGISDIDMVAIFEPEATIVENPLEFADADRYLFIHNLYGATKEHFDEARKYTFFHNYKLLWGQEMKCVSPLSEEAQQILKIQTALEFLVKMYVNLSLQITYGIVKVRSLLLHTKGILYDLEFLNISSGRLHELVDQMMQWRENWLNHAPGSGEVRSWAYDFFGELELFLHEAMKNNKFYLMPADEYRVTRNYVIKPSEEMAFTHHGMPLPNMFSKLGKKYFNVQNRFNHFELKLPVESNEIPKVIEERFEALQRMKKHNQRQLPYFSPLTSSLDVL